MSGRPPKPTPVVVKRAPEQRRKLPPELEAFARSDDEKLRIRRARVDKGRVRDPREGYTVAGVANRDARSLYDVRTEAMRALWAGGAADDVALAELGQLFHDALRLELWRARRLTDFAAFAEDVVGVPVARAEALAHDAAGRTGEPVTPLTQREIALWMRTEAGLYEGDDRARARIRQGERGLVLEITVDLVEASTALAGVGARHLPLARAPRYPDERGPQHGRTPARGAPRDEELEFGDEPAASIHDDDHGPPARAQAVDETDEHTDLPDADEHAELADESDHAELADADEHGEPADADEHGEPADADEHGEPADADEHGEPADALDGVEHEDDEMPADLAVAQQADDEDDDAHSPAAAAKPARPIAGARLLTRKSGGEPAARQDERSAHWGKREDRGAAPVARSGRDERRPRFERADDDRVHGRRDAGAGATGRFGRGRPDSDGPKPGHDRGGFQAGPKKFGQDRAAHGGARSGQDRGGFQGGARSGQDRGGFQGSARGGHERGGFQSGGRFGQDRGGFQGGARSGQDRGGFQGSARGGHERGGFQGGVRSGQDRGGFQGGARGGQERGGFQGGVRCGQDRGGFQGGVRSGQDRGGFQGGARSGDDRAGFQGGSDRGGFQGGGRGGSDRGGFQGGGRGGHERGGFQGGVRSGQDRGGFQGGGRGGSDRGGFQGGGRPGRDGAKFGGGKFGGANKFGKPGGGKFGKSAGDRPGGAGKGGFGVRQPVEAAGKRRRDDEPEE